MFYSTLLGVLIGLALYLSTQKYFPLQQSSYSFTQWLCLILVSLGCLVWLYACSKEIVECDDLKLLALPDVLAGAVLASMHARQYALDYWQGTSRVLRTIARYIPLMLSIPLALLCIELPYNPALFSMNIQFVVLNLALFAVFITGIWFIAQRNNLVLPAILLIFFIVGIIQYFVCTFKSTVFVPADLMSVGTALAVAGGYSYHLEGAFVPVLSCLLLFWAVCLLSPRSNSSRAPHSELLVNMLVGIALLGSLVVWYRTCDIDRDYNVKVDIWFTRESYQRNGCVPSFLKLLQELEPVKPEGYTPQIAADIQHELARAWSNEHPSYPTTLQESQLLALQETNSDELPSIIVVMNETFSDLSRFDAVQGYEGLTIFDSIPDAHRGSVYVSTRGGGTCNSEFEYLTTSSIAYIAAGMNPYVYYDLSVCESLPKYYEALGYTTSALHPAPANNWRRETIYSQMGFARFYSIDAFEGAETLRNKVVDTATYDLALELLEFSKPQFIFDVTIQNHSGYTTGELADDHEFDDVVVSGEVLEDMDEFLTCIALSERQLDEFISQLSQVDRKVLLVFFGDHQPYMDDRIAELTFNRSVGEFDLNQIQSRYETPFLVWANYDAGIRFDNLPQYVDLGYLSAYTAYIAGLPLTEYQKAVLQLHEGMPLINANGFMDSQYVWHSFDETSDASSLYEQYSLIQYASLFDASGNNAFTEFAREAIQ